MGTGVRELLDPVNEFLVFMAERDLKSLGTQPQTLALGPHLQRRCFLRRWAGGWIRALNQSLLLCLLTGCRTGSASSDASSLPPSFFILLRFLFSILTLSLCQI